MTPDGVHSTYGGRLDGINTRRRERYADHGPACPTCRGAGGTWAGPWWNRCETPQEPTQ